MSFRVPWQTVAAEKPEWRLMADGDIAAACSVVVQFLHRNDGDFEMRRQGNWIEAVHWSQVEFGAQGEGVSLGFGLEAALKVVSHADHLLSVRRRYAAFTMSSRASASFGSMFRSARK